MQIVIPMSGFGERFRQAGYDVPKPLIEIEGKPVIAHVAGMFPGEDEFLFICNKDHLNNPAYRMEETLKRYCPRGKVVGIDPHKLGPVHAVLQAADAIDQNGPIIVNYCDFTCYWNWERFKAFVKQCRCDGAIPAYKGFHPHSLGGTNYAYMREENGWLLDIREKQPFTENRMEEYASSGTYYFATGQMMLEAMRAQVKQKLQTEGEYYVSITYKPLLAAGRKIAVYELQHFMQWGAPEDVTAYNYWSKTFRQLIDPKFAQKNYLGGTVIVPMAGLGQRFLKEGYATTKPLIPVSGLPMVLQATRDLPKADRYVFVLRRDMPGYEEIADSLKRQFPSVLIETLESVTEGQACTALLGLEAAEKAFPDGEVPGPITFGACDNGALYDVGKLAALMKAPETDVVVWGVRGYANAARYPKMYGWIDAAGEAIGRVSVKVPLDDPANDPIVLGTFTFRSAEAYRRCVERMTGREGKVNGEYYIDTCVNDALALDMGCRLFEVDSYLCWGTPNDLRTFEYWQSCFHKWPAHPYRLESDPRVPKENVAALEERFREQIPSMPEFGA